MGDDQASRDAPAFQQIKTFRNGETFPGVKTR